jgi:hypothetical protein
MRSDKELIELAARAVGLTECGWMGESFMYVKDNTFTDWNPLVSLNDADMVKKSLVLVVEVSCNTIQARRLWRAPVVENFHTVDQRGPATRRAITRAAAEIGAKL